MQKSHSTPPVQSAACRVHLAVQVELLDAVLEPLRVVQRDPAAPPRGDVVADGDDAVDLVRAAGVEPARPQGREILSLLCLPISPPGRIF